MIKIIKLTGSSIRWTGSIQWLLVCTDRSHATCLFCGLLKHYFRGVILSNYIFCFLKVCGILRLTCNTSLQSWNVMLLIFFQMALNIQHARSVWASGACTRHRLCWGSGVDKITLGLHMCLYGRYQYFDLNYV